jgi:hypothetical protein
METYRWYAVAEDDGAHGYVSKLVHTLVSTPVKGFTCIYIYIYIYMYIYGYI